MSRIHELLIIPAAGHAGPGVYSRGWTIDALAEVDLVDQYVRSLVDELEQSSIRFRLVPTRRSPGTAEKDRYALADDYVLPIVCAIGWNSAQTVTATKNTSSVKMSLNLPLSFGRDLVDVISHWGSLYVHGHRCSAPVQSEIVRGIIIEPFRLNGPDVAAYAAKLDKLGRDIGRFLADYCLAKNLGTAVRAPSLLRRIQ